MEKAITNAGAYLPFVHRIPESTYTAWLDSVWAILENNSSPETGEMVKKATLKLLQKYILREYRTYKLMAFEEIRKGEHSKIPYGFYIKLRLMYPVEQAQADWLNGLSDKEMNSITRELPDNPQWTLELDSIPADDIKTLLIN